MRHKGPPILATEVTDYRRASGCRNHRRSAAPSRVITISGTSNHHHLEFVITITWND